MSVGKWRFESFRVPVSTGAGSRHIEIKKILFLINGVDRATWLACCSKMMSAYGLWDGISKALISCPPAAETLDLLVSATYVVVLFPSWYGA